MECSVCFEVYDQASHKPVSLPCGHLLCDACIPALGNDSPSCPTCRLPFSKDQEAVNGIRHLYLDLQDCSSRDDQDGLTSPQKEEASQLASALRGLSVDAPVQDIEDTLTAVRGWVPSVTRIKDLETKVVLSRLLFNVEVLQSKFKDIKRLRTAAASAKRLSIDAQMKQEAAEALSGELRVQNAALKKGSMEANSIRHKLGQNSAAELRRKDDELQEAQKFTALLLDQLQQSQSRQQLLEAQLAQAQALLSDVRRTSQQQAMGGSQRNEDLTRAAEQNRSQALYWRQQAEALQRDLDLYRRGPPPPLPPHIALATSPAPNQQPGPPSSSPSGNWPPSSSPSGNWTYPTQFTFSAPPPTHGYPAPQRTGYHAYPSAPIASSSRVPLERVPQPVGTYPPPHQAQKRPLETDGAPPLVSAPKRMNSGPYIASMPDHQPIADPQQQQNFMFNLPPS